MLNIQYHSEHSRMDDRIQLNVGGELYTTTRTTLSNCGENMLSNLVSGKYSDKNEYFIDRDGTTFREILNFLRTLERYELPSNSDKLNALLIEAEYYAMSPLIEKIQERLDHQKVILQITLPYFNHKTDDDFRWYVCSDNASESFKNYINKCKSEKRWTTFNEIIAFAEEQGFYLIQTITATETNRESVTCLIFRGC